MASSRALTCGFVVWLVLAAALPASAGEVLFSIRDGRVTLTAHNANISDILAVWEKEGRTKIVARERVQGVVASLELVNEPEASALATVLRNVTGYIAARREVAPSDASTYRCIVINPVPAPAMVAQAATTAPMGRGAASLSQPMGYQQQSMGYPQQSMGYPSQAGGVDYNSNPPMYVPPPDDGDDSGGGGASRMPTVPGLRPPPMASPAGGTGRPPFDTYGAPSAQPPRQPGLTPNVPGSSAAPQVPGAPAQPVVKPPGLPGQK